LNGSNIEVIAGVNLAMLIKFAAVRETSSLEQAVIQASMFRVPPLTETWAPQSRL
jgi:mannose/fructose-specific phosphotransferase system component IIA